ncbi:MAG: D-alanine--D-alanine ligase [Lachnospiraceae bacterium]|nr:D-alanine--D-alanine ligase [bacterium]MDY5518662.1 D-alanine--D-alanine ligase [Lachnospiraceae bacterium]
MNIVVLAGGLSPERDVSLVTGSNVCKALRENGHKVILMDVFMGREGNDVEHWFERSEEVSVTVSGIAETAPDLAAVKASRADQSDCFFGPNVIALCQMADIVFMALHGENGENGKIQAAFDLFGIRYTGSDYLSSAIAMNKELTKKVLAAGGVPVPRGFSVKKGVETAKQPGFPCVVKPCCGGSSIGVSIVNDQKEYEQALEEAFRWEEEVVVEQYIQGREFAICVIDGKALPIIEIAPISGFYDYKNKYQAGSTIETCPAMLPEVQTKEMQGYAELAAKVIGLDTYSRMDFLMDDDGRMYCLEANTLPGMTPTSLIPQEAAAMGVSYHELCEQLIQISLKKMEKCS